MVAQYAPTGTHAQATVPVDTTAVVRTTLTTTTQLSGTLGYAGSYQLTPQLPGTITALPAPGAVIHRGQSVYEVDGRAVFAWYGARPAWRRFAVGMTPGPDVLELEQNLAALGFGGEMSVDDTFTWATAQAVRDWQDATSQPVTGAVELGRIAFAPTALRIISDDVPLSAVAGPGQPVVTASSPAPVVTVAVPATQTYLVHRGDRVTVTVPSGATSSGRVVAISSVAASSTDSSDSPGNQSSGQNASNGQNGSQQVTVPAQVSLDRPSIAAQLDQAPVTVAITDRQVKDALAVPITSLVALAGGGYGVWVDAGGTRHLVGVSPGLFADTLVQVPAVAPEMDDAALVSFPIAHSDLGQDSGPTRIYLRTDPDQVAAVAGVLPFTASPQEPEAVELRRPSDILQARVAAKTAFVGLFLALGAVALLVGGVGIANIMVISVLERRGEIGLPRA
jgi:Putative peptidoglycan binding domain